jgi:hypothetical protein
MQTDASARILCVAIDPFGGVARVVVHCQEQLSAGTAARCASSASCSVAIPSATPNGWRWPGLPPPPQPEMLTWSRQPLRVSSWGVRSPLLIRRCNFEVWIVNRPSGPQESRAALAGIQVIGSPSWCSPERLCTSSTSRCLRPDSRALIIPGVEPQITMPAGIATARSGAFVTSWYL